MVVYTTCFLSAKSSPEDFDVAIFHENPVLYIYTYMGNMEIPPLSKNLHEMADIRRFRLLDLWFFGSYKRYSTGFPG